MKKYIYPIVIFSLISFTAYSQELRGGEISLNRVVYHTYDIFFDLYYHNLEPPYKPFLLVDLDGVPDTAFLSTVIDIDNEMSLLRYYTTHTFPGTNASVAVIDTLYLPELKNLQGPNKDKLRLFTFFEIHSVALGFNVPPTFTNLQTDYEITDGIFSYNIEAADADRDTLFYFAKDFSDFPGYEYSYPGIPDTTYFMNPLTGEVLWDRPLEPGKYLIGFDVEEYTTSAIYLGTWERIMVVEIKEEDIVPLSVQGQEKFPLFTISPNPAGEKISLSFSNPIFQKNIKIKAYNTIGQIVFEKEIMGSGEEEIDVKNWPPGIYFINIETGEKTWTEKLVVK